MSARRGVLIALAALTAAISAGAAMAPTRSAAVTDAAGCLPSGDGYLRARIRGVRNLDLDWHNAELECQGEAREDAPGIRLSFLGPVSRDGHRLRLVFGVRSRREAGDPEHALPTNLTVIFEGEQRLYATQGYDKCTVDQLRKERRASAEAGAAARLYRVVARGFCVAPASALGGGERILVESFDFAGRIEYGDRPGTAPPARAAR